MRPLSTYSVVGVCADGSRTMLASQASRESAEIFLSQLSPQSDYSHLQLLIDGEWPPPVQQPLRPKPRRVPGLIHYPDVI